MKGLKNEVDKEKGFAGIELAIIIGLIGVLHGIVVPNLLAARRGANEAAALGSLRTLVTAQAFFYDRDSDKDGIKNYAQTLNALGQLQLISADLATGLSQGYVFDLTTSQDRQHWKAVASPEVPGKTGDRYFVVDESGVIQFFSCPGQKFDPILLQCVAEETSILRLGLDVVKRVNGLGLDLALPMAQSFVMSPSNVQTMLSKLDENGDGMLTFDELLNADLLKVARSVQPGLGGGGAGGQAVGPDSALRAILRSYLDSLRMNFALGAGNEGMAPGVALSGMSGDPGAFLAEVPAACPPVLECIPF